MVKLMVVKELMKEIQHSTCLKMFEDDFNYLILILKK